MSGLFERALGEVHGPRQPATGRHIEYIVVLLARWHGTKSCIFHTRQVAAITPVKPQLHCIVTAHRHRFTEYAGRERNFCPSSEMHASSYLTRHPTAQSTGRGQSDCAPATLLPRHTTASCGTDHFSSIQCARCHFVTIHDRNVLVRLR